MHGPEHDPPAPSRRAFLSASGRFVGGSWLTLKLPLLSTIAACSRDAARDLEPFTTFSPREGEAMGAFAETIIPSGTLPGAREAGATYFADRALADAFPEWLGLVRPGLADLDERAAAGRGSGGSGGERSAFAGLSPDDRAEIVGQIEETPFFFVARMLVVMGTFCDPARGGNRDHVGWSILGMAHAPAYDSPFGYYDREALAAGIVEPEGIETSGADAGEAEPGGSTGDTP